MGGGGVNKIDIKNWKPKNLKDLFDILLSQDDIQPKKCLENGTIPVISSGKFSNGIITYINSNKNYTVYDKNTITIDMFGKAFYQDKNYYSVSHGRINILKPKFQLNKYRGLFFITLFDINFKKYSFTLLCNKNQLNKEVILLKLNNNNEIDFEYMESYMKTIEEKTKNKLKLIEKIIN